MPAAAPPRRPVARKQPQHFRLDPEVMRMLHELEQITNETRTALVETAVRNLYRSRTGRAKPQENPPEKS